MARHRVEITGPDYPAMADLVRKHRTDVVRHTVARTAAGYSVQALADDAQITALERAGYTVRRLENADEAGRARQAEAAAGGRYLAVSEVESALSALAQPPNDTFVQLLTPPHQTWEARVCHAVKVGKGTNPGRVGVCLIGGVHAREWGSPDILIFFLTQLAGAYRGGTGLSLGGKTFTAAQVKAVVDTKDLYVFPQVNPDGRHHSLTVDPSWRMNRRPGPANSPTCAGVDINRNYDFLWRYTEYFSPDAPVANSTDPCDPQQTYIGPGPASEPETRNVVWMFDTFPGIRYFIDLHSYGEKILYCWGDDEDQTADPGMNFRNPAYDGKRGVVGDAAYREYIPPDDRAAVVALAGQMWDAIAAVRGRAYEVEQSLDLYPTAGTSDDYAFSRHLADPARPKVYGFTIEWGRDSNPTPFHPPYPEMKQVMAEVAAGLLEFCVRAS
jgi:murein tripeptide amidase MpaA